MDPALHSAELSFACRHCSRHCQITRHRLEEQVFFSGGACRRWDDERAHGEAPVPGEDLAAGRVRLWRHHAGLDAEHASEARVVGLPRALYTPLGLPLWTAVVRAMGRRPVLSGAATPEVLQRGRQALPEVSCLPVHATMGQVVELHDQGVEEVLLPGWWDAASTGECAQAWRALEEQVRDRCRCPHVRLNADPWSGHAEAAEALGITRAQLGLALQQGIVSMHRLRRDLQALGRPVLDANQGPLGVLMSPWCSLSDPELDQELTRELTGARLGVVPMDCLPLDRVSLGSRWQPHARRLGTDLVRAVALCHEDPRLVPVVVHGQGCGAELEVEALLPDGPHLLLDLEASPSRRALEIQALVATLG